MKKSELKELPRLEIAIELLKKKPKQNTAEIFKQICSLLDKSDKFFEDEVAQFFTELTVNKRFIILEDGTWDLKENNAAKPIKFEDDEDEDEDDDIEMETIETPSEKKNNDTEEEIEENSDFTDDEDDVVESLEDEAELKNLVIVDESELEN